MYESEIESFRAEVMRAATVQAAAYLFLQPLYLTSSEKA